MFLFIPVKKFAGYLVLFLILGPAYGKETTVARIDSLYIEAGTLMGSLRIDHMMDKQIMNGLGKGMTAVIEYRVQIWQIQNWGIKSLIQERFRRLKINYNHWEHKYQVYDKDGESRFFDEPDLITYCQQIRQFKIGSIDPLLTGEAYRVFAQIMIKPMSVENLEELKHWLSGEADDFDANSIYLKKSPVKKAGDWMLNIVVNLTGFGDRVLTGKSPVFYISGNRQLLQEPE